MTSALIDGSLRNSRQVFHWHEQIHASKTMAAETVERADHEYVNGTRSAPRRYTMHERV